MKAQEKYLEHTKAMVPYFETDGSKQWAMMTFTGRIHNNKVIHEVRRFIEHNFKVKVSKEWVKVHVPIISTNIEDIKAREGNMGAAVEEFIKRIEQRDENEDGTDTEGQSSNVTSPEEPLRSVSDRPVESTE